MYKVLERARVILEQSPPCLYHDPHFVHDGMARRADGVPTSPENKPAVMFTLTGSVARAVWELTGETWVDRHILYSAALQPIMDRTCLDHTRFLFVCDRLGREKCLRLIDEVLEI
jgi:hypothetical protein